ncbi:MAG: hypothetical protein M0R05_02560 [Bacilli bacterium]|nr:hypothetical protein [Bacilli bacterium]MDD4077137.1 hypothetical protein [Bacilli bacterium]MDD4388043.1 hypothetical protein [Bacilli bacterium]
MAKSEKMQLTVYELDPSGKYRYVKSQADVPIINANMSEAVTSPKIPEERAFILRGNPFLYNPENSGVEVYSIEDFLIMYKKKEVILGEIIRNPDYSLKSRKNILKKAFRNWHKAYTKKKKQVFRDNFRTIEVVKGIGNVKFPLYIELIIWLMLTAMIFILGTNSPLWNKIVQGKFGLFLQTTLNTMYGSSPWLKSIGHITIYLLFVLVFYSLFFRVIVHDYKLYYRKTQNYLENSESQINREYKKKRKNAYKYYLRHLRKKSNPYYPPLDIKEVQEGKVNITIFNIVSKATVNKSYYLMKIEPFLKTIKVILLFLSIAGLILVYGYSIVSLIIAAF